MCYLMYVERTTTRARTANKRYVQSTYDFQKLLPAATSDWHEKSLYKELINSVKLERSS